MSPAICCRMHGYNHVGLFLFMPVSYSENDFMVLSYRLRFKFIKNPMESHLTECSLGIVLVESAAREYLGFDQNCRNVLKRAIAPLTQL